MPVTVLGGQGEPGGSSPTVEITVGGWGPIPVVLDTGSSGLHVFAGAVNAATGGGARCASRTATSAANAAMPATSITPMTMTSAFRPRMRGLKA